MEKSKISSFTPGRDGPIIDDLISFVTGPNNTSDLILKPEGIAYDWVTDTFYYADNGLNIIASYQISSKNRYIIAYSDSPRAIVVHPCKGFVFFLYFRINRIILYYDTYRLLFWSDVGVFPSIRRSTLTGRQVTYVITTNIRWPNGLTIDFDDDRIYWADAWL